MVTQHEQVAAMARAVRTNLTKLTDQQVSDLVVMWAEAWAELEPELLRVFNDLTTGRGLPNHGELEQARRLTAAGDLIQQRASQLTQGVVDYLHEQLKPTILAVLEDHLASIAAQLPADTLGTLVTYNKLRPAQLDWIVARSTTQIHAATAQLGTEMVTTMKAQLVKAVTLGEHPLVAAEAIVDGLADGFNGGLARASRIARTEMLDAARHATLVEDQSNTHVLSHWVWHAKLDGHTCRSCIAMHGTEHDLDEFGPIDHPNGRCARVTITKTWAELGIPGMDDFEQPAFETGEEWFSGLTVGSQQDILGKDLWDSWKAGGFEFSDLSTLRANTAWRDARYETPKKKLITPAD